MSLPEPLSASLSWHCRQLVRLLRSTRRTTPPDGDPEQSRSPVRLRLGDVSVDLILEKIERQRATPQYCVVEVADIEARSELALRLGAQLSDLQLADLVGERLSRARNVAIDFG